MRYLRKPGDRDSFVSKPQTPNTKRDGKEHASRAALSSYSLMAVDVMRATTGGAGLGAVAAAGGG
jgi:hypothetical protein